MGEPVKSLRVGVIGAGKISGQYTKTLLGIPYLPVTSVPI